MTSPYRENAKESNIWCTNEGPLLKLHLKGGSEWTIRADDIYRFAKLVDDGNETISIRMCNDPDRFAFTLDKPDHYEQFEKAYDRALKNWLWLVHGRRQE